MSNIRIVSEKPSLVPKVLLGYELFRNLDALYRAIDNEDIIYNLSEIDPKPLHDIIELYVSIVNSDSSREEIRYIVKRLLAMKSAEKVLWELEKYTNIKYDINVDPESPPLLNTRYSPSRLQVTIESIETDQPESILETLHALYAALLYYKDFELTIRELVIRINVTIKEDTQIYLLSGYNITNLVDHRLINE